MIDYLLIFTTDTIELSFFAGNSKKELYIWMSDVMRHGIARGTLLAILISIDFINLFYVYKSIFFLPANSCKFLPRKVKKLFLREN